MKKLKFTKKALSVVFAMVLMLSHTRVAVAGELLSMQEVVEQVAVPVAQSNERENYTYDELANLIQNLNENGITLDEGSIVMEAFKSGHGYWKRDTIEEICRSVFGYDQDEWLLEQKHWFGEMMVAIGAVEYNISFLPEEGELTLEGARSLAAKTLMEAYGVDLPLNSDETWQIYETFEPVWDEKTNSFSRESAQWEVWYAKRIALDDMTYKVTIDRYGQNAVAWRASYLENINAASISNAYDDLERRDGSAQQWGVETWADFGKIIWNIPPQNRREWLFQNAGYCLPPKNAITLEQALKIANEETGMIGSIEENIICCQEGDHFIYKVCQRVFFESAKKGEYDAIWCVELNCESGKVLSKREYTYEQGSDYMMMYVPFSILNSAPIFEPDAKQIQIEQMALERYKKEEMTKSLYGDLVYFWPFDIQADIYGEPYTIPSQEEYDVAVKVAMKAIVEKYEPDALNKLGQYKVGAICKARKDDQGTIKQLIWDFMFTTDTDWLSDGYRVQFRLNCDVEIGTESIVDLEVEHANWGNG